MELWYNVTHTIKRIDQNRRSIVNATITFHVQFIEVSLCQNRIYEADGALTYTCCAGWLSESHTEWIARAHVCACACRKRVFSVYCNTVCCLCRTRHTHTHAQKRLRERPTEREREESFNGRQEKDGKRQTTTIIYIFGVSFVRKLVKNFCNFPMPRGWTVCASAKRIFIGIAFVYNTNVR